MDKDELKNRISMALKDPILQQGFEIICKENAELEQKLYRRKSEKGCETCTKFDEVQLIKAKEIIKVLLPCCRNYPQENAEKIKQAEQFIKEVEK